MLNFWLGFTFIEKIFCISATLGSLFFLIRVLYLIMGLGTTQADLEGDDLSDSLDSDSISESLEVDRIPFFKSFLSLQNLSAFFMMFGWVGLAMTKGSGFHLIPALIAGFLSGAILSWLLVKITNLTMKLKSTGNARMSSAIGKVGRVYLRIPKGASGQVEVEVDGRLKVLDAISSDDSIEILSDTKVLVVDLDDSNLVVKPLS